MEAGEEIEEAAEAEGCNIKILDLSLTIHDLMMLENQIPFSVVEKIYKLRYGDAATAVNGSVMSVGKLAWETIRNIMDEVPPSSNNNGVEKCQHLVHVCRVYLRPTSLAEAAYVGEYGRFRRATEYYEAGVRFRGWSADDGSKRPLLDVMFLDGMLRMALQIIDEKTGYILRNVLAYEQKYYQAATSIGEAM
ncbi:hypothetical protein EJB05_15668, partial [Eragrostis curvula]